MMKMIECCGPGKRSLQNYTKWKLCQNVINLIFQIVHLLKTI